MNPSHPAVLLELDEDTWSSQLDRVERWLATTRALQGGYRHLLESAVDDVEEPHVRTYLQDLLDVARRHENAVDDLYRAFGHRGRLFACEWGTLAPINSPRAEDLEHGFKVVGVNVTDGTAEDFVRNARPGPASALGEGGIERPVDCAFDPAGHSLYVLDFGVVRVEEAGMFSYAHTGVLWRVTVE